MKLSAFLKLLLICTSVGLLVWLNVANYQTYRMCKELDPSDIKLKNDPLLDSSVNRIRYAKKNQEINQRYNQIWELRKKRHFSLFNSLICILAIINGWIIRKFWRDIFKKNKANKPVVN